MRNSSFWWLFIAVLLMLDFYVFQALKVITQPATVKTRFLIHAGYWFISAVTIITFLLLPIIKFEKQNLLAKSAVFSIIVGIFFAKLVASFFFLTDDLRRGIQWGTGKLFSFGNNSSSIKNGEKISRSLFLSWTGMLAGGGLLGSLIYGFGNKYRYQLKKIPLKYENLPQAFKGLRIAHISDIHAGSFTNKEAVMKGVQKIMDEQPDLILFTGDLVNNVAEEMDEYIEVFGKLQPPLGVFSVLGNHDYGDYVNWKSAAHKTENFEKIKNVHKKMGWRLLLNEHAVLQKGQETLAIIGVENWSAKARFPKYGNLQQAIHGAENHPFKILLSHDPSHWRAEVLDKYPEINLVLSGHTHGMQFGLEIPGLKWSPVQYVYREWAGLYEHLGTDNMPRRLYVNRGFGFLGYPGRVGILPEITILELS